MVNELPTTDAPPPTGYDYDAILSQTKSQLSSVPPKAITLYRVFNPGQGHIYVLTEEEAVVVAKKTSLQERDEVFSIDKVTSKIDIRKAILEVFLEMNSFWWRTEIISYWENGERYGNAS